jgi:hypothetical protein
MALHNQYHSFKEGIIMEHFNSLSPKSCPSYELDKNEFYLAGYKRGKEDLFHQKCHSASSHSLKITSLHSYQRMADYESGYHAAYPK